MFNLYIHHVERCLKKILDIFFFNKKISTPAPPGVGPQAPLGNTVIVLGRGAFPGPGAVPLENTVHLLGKTWWASEKRGGDHEIKLFEIPPQ